MYEAITEYSTCNLQLQTKSQGSGCLQFAQVSSGAEARAIDARKVIRSEEIDLDFRFSLALRFVFASLLVSSTLFFPFINYATL